jgi:hypothetical protein
MSTPKPFTLRVSDDDMADLRARLGRTLFPDQAPGRALGLRRRSRISSRPVSYWRDRFDWHAQETKLNISPVHSVFPEEFQAASRFTAARDRPALSGCGGAGTGPKALAADARLAKAVEFGCKAVSGLASD